MAKKRAANKASVKRSNQQAASMNSATKAIADEIARDGTVHTIAPAEPSCCWASSLNICGVVVCGGML